jgi:serine protease
MILLSRSPTGVGCNHMRNHDKDRVNLLIVLCALLAIQCIWTHDGCARTWCVNPDGSGEAPTIEAGIDSAAAGDTVLVGCGTYDERAIVMKSGVALVSESGEADCVTIDAEYLNRVFKCEYCDSVTLIQGFTVTRGTPYLGNPGSGGAMFVLSGSRLVIENCEFLNNQTHHGAGVYCDMSSPTFVNCVFRDNYGITEGGGLFCNNASPRLETCVFADNRAGRGGAMFCTVGAAPVLTNCTFYGNVAYDDGAGIYSDMDAAPVLERCLIANSLGGGAIRCEIDFFLFGPTLTCCDLYGNLGGDWEGYIADQLGVNGNFSADPLFCDTAGGDLTLEECSPCLPGHHPDGYGCGGVIGTFGSGCECGAGVEPATWGSIKALHR